MKNKDLSKILIHMIKVVNTQDLKNAITRNPRYKIKYYIPKISGFSFLII